MSSERYLISSFWMTFLSFLRQCIDLSKFIRDPEGCSLTGQVLDLLPSGHQFESHKSQGHLRLTWSLTSVPVGLVEVRTN
jgi:hypothetical protein